MRTLSAELRALVRAKLPDYMVPAALVMLAAMPLTPNGKLDRRALPAPGSQRPELATFFVAPRSELEHALVALWQKLLQVDDIGVDDSFFDLGGNSIHAAQVLARLRSTFNTEVTFARFFGQPTVAALGEILHELGTNSPAAAAIAALPRDGALALSFAQERLFFLYQLAPEGRAYNCPSGFRLTGPLDEQALARSLRELVQRHEILRTRFLESAGRPTQLIDPQTNFSLVGHDLQQLSPMSARSRPSGISVKRRSGSSSWKPDPCFGPPCSALGRRKTSCC